MTTMLESTIEDYRHSLQTKRTETLSTAAVVIAEAVADHKPVPVQAMAEFTAARRLLHPPADEALS